jgi:hypothetical protein
VKRQGRRVNEFLFAVDGLLDAGLAPAAAAAPCGHEGDRATATHLQ